MEEWEKRDRRLFLRYRAGHLGLKDLIHRLGELPYQNLPFAKVDLHRAMRRNFAEVIYAKGKTSEQVIAIAQVLHQNGSPVLVTKLSSRMAKAVRRRLPWLRYFPEARIGAGPAPKPRNRGLALVVTAGTGDIPVAEEAAVTLQFLGTPVRRLFDVGVAGLHRLLSHQKILRKARAIVVAAGMDGALPSVISGLVSCPVIAVPTSVGYGASFKGVAPLLTMLNSCSPGVAVVNIDNGFGAGYLAAMIAK